MIGFRLLDCLERRLQVRPCCHCGIQVILQRIQRIAEVKWAGYVKRVYRRTVVAHLQKLNLCSVQVHGRRLDLRLVLHALQLDAIEIDLCDVARLEAVLAYLDDVVVVVKIRLCHIEHKLGLERCHERRAQGEHHVALQVLMMRLRDASAFLSALEAQIALMFALIEVTEVGLLIRALERTPAPVMRRDLRAIGR